MIRRTLVFIVAIVALFVFSAWLFSDIFIYLCVSIVLATILRPLTNLINRAYIFRMRMPRILAILVSYCAVVGVVFSFVLLFIPLIVEQVNVLSKVSFDEVYTNLSQPIVAIENFLIEYQLVSEDEHSLTETIRSSVFEFVSNLNFRNIINNLLTFTGGFFVSVLAIAFITFFLLLENGLLSRRLIAIVPNQYFELFISAIHKIEHLLSNYLIGLVLQMMAIFSIAGLGLSIFGVKYALTIAVFAAVANLIPYMGPILGASFGIIVGLSTSGHFAFDQVAVILILKIVSVFAVVQATDNVLLQPLIFSKSVKAHPLEIFVVIFAAASLAGIPGMIAAIPVYTIIRVSVIEIRAGFKSYRIFQVSKNII
ncbi:Predicted PurR-regulated permease PerM [Reichenbachiella faecimaris]|uniref:Predicted PurR-regulated permease PerM n=1 Tax=Reichenbachiella faecimaris TaxID=692418 RepID=A0A1W2GKY5_REIFA|nr:AI-2E family transporter [Reichenbachiella faecimaris]SMD37214.1 Predicted PurR-regulated permease PerM [Reichenbachiella faecimaris]